jgi:hypothetical protein
VAVCPDLAATPLGLCSGHESRYRTQGRPGGAALPQAWSRSYERQDLPVPVSYPRRHTPRLLASVKPGLTGHGLMHGHKTWMAEDGIPEILAEQRLGHQVPGMRGLYTHASDRMRDDLKNALQARWEDSLHDRAAIAPRSPVPLLDALLGPLRATAQLRASRTAPAKTPQHQPAPGDREKLISQIPQPP